MTPVYIFDLDGTLALHHHRLHHLLNSKDHEAFEQACSQDKANIPVLAILEAVATTDAEIWFVTARSDAVKVQTLQWLWQMTSLPQRTICQNLVMRKAGDHRPDHVVKLEWLKSKGDTFRARIAAVFEDRDRVVKMWRDQGITCLQVAEGNF